MPCKPVGKDETSHPHDQYLQEVVELTVSVDKVLMWVAHIPNVTPKQPLQVWNTDMSFVRLHSGFVYLVVMDWFSRYGLSWVISITMEVGFCLDALEQALGRERSDTSAQES
jgi:transposase InsO family protein